MLKPKLGDVVAVEWSDAWFDQDETAVMDYKEHMYMTTYGVLRRNGEIVSVAGEPSEDGRDRAVTHIPRGMIRRIRVLERGN